MKPILPPTAETQSETRRMLIAMVLMGAILMGWQAFYQPPPPPPLVDMNAPATTLSTPAQTLSREEAIVAEGKRLPIRSEQVHGSLSLTGARFDDITLAKYRETVDPRSPEIVLLAPAGTQSAYFAEFGWLAEKGIEVPNPKTVWKTEADAIRPNQRAVLWWENKQGLRFERRITLDSAAMFTIEDVVLNQSGAPVTLTPFGRVQRRFADDPSHHGRSAAISHEGGVGVLGGELHEVKYDKLRKDGAQKFTSTGGWLGFGDKYWLTAAVLDGGAQVNAQFSVLDTVTDPKTTAPLRYQADFTAAPRVVEVGQSLTTSTRLFAGAKEVNVLDGYAKAGVPLFDRAVDFGWLYFLTKPMFTLLNILYHGLGNFGLAILALTVLIKLAMFPLASKSHRAMSKMKTLQPEMQVLKEKHGEDKLRMQQEVMALYKREQVNPASGCLPILIQIPVFFALYKVLFVTIEMRHAPFFGWIRDLSAPDPSNLFTLFGAVEWAVPPFLHLGWWPIVMCLTMILQQSLNPKPTDKSQAIVMTIMPYFFLYLLSGFPVGLVIYWSWSNTLTILQQLFITRSLKRDEAKLAARKTAAPAIPKAHTARKKAPTITKPKKR